MNEGWDRAITLLGSILTELQQKGETADDVTATAPTYTTVPSSASSTALFAANANARGRSIFNDSTQSLWIAENITATTTTGPTEIPARFYFVFPRPLYTGAVNGIWVAANGNARLTERT